MKQIGYCVLLAATIALAYGSAVWAAESAAAPAKPEAKAAPASVASSNAIGVTLTGKNYCPEKALRGDANPTCSTEGCRNALKVSDAKDEKGGALPELKGATVHYLYSDAVKPLWSDKANVEKMVTVTGTLYKNERALDVKSFKLAPDAKEDFTPAAAKKKSGDDFDNFDYTKGGGSASQRIVPAH